MLEAAPPEVVDNFPSPRILNSHYLPRLYMYLCGGHLNGNKNDCTVELVIHVNVLKITEVFERSNVRQNVSHDNPYVTWLKLCIVNV